MMSNARKISLAISSLGLAALLVLFIRNFISSPPPNEDTLSVSSIRAEFALTSHNGERVTNQTYSGQYLLVFFGFTYCPDVCPFSLDKMSLALEDIGDIGDKIQPLFITVDPERDTPGEIASYLQSFHPSFIGLTGTAEEIRAAAQSFKVFYRRSQEMVDDADEASETSSNRGDSEDYLVDHSSIIYLMGPDGAFIRHFDPTMTGADIRAKLAQLIAE